MTELTASLPFHNLPEMANRMRGVSKEVGT